MLGHIARTVLVKTCPLNWAVAAGLVVWQRAAPGMQEAGGMIEFFSALAIAGTLIASVRYQMGRKPATELLDALLAAEEAGHAANPETGDAPGVLRLVQPGGQSARAAGQKTAG